mmetsp:Transcript_11353/g.25810  ORF Transcript_11353/g.25810 Transcript_11353/m.25810 type:complete len:141 (+) Transcript_11353:104-526(+)
MEGEIAVVVQWQTVLQRHTFLETASLEEPPALIRGRAMSDSFLVDHACALERLLLAEEQLDEQEFMPDGASTTSTALPGQAEEQDLGSDVDSNSDEERETFTRHSSRKDLECEGDAQFNQCWVTATLKPATPCACQEHDA